MEVARFEQRVIAFLIDYLFAIVFSLSGTILLAVLVPSMSLLFLILSFAGLTYAFFLITYPLMMSFFNGRSLGSLIVATKVIYINKDAKISLRDIYIKALMMGLFPLAIVNSVYMLVVHTERSIFDKLTNTIVVDNKKELF